MTAIEMIPLLGVAGLGLSMAPWKSWFHRAPRVPGSEMSLLDSVTKLRYYCSTQPKETRDRGLESCDTLDAIVSSQPLLKGPNYSPEDVSPEDVAFKKREGKAVHSYE